MEFDTLKDELLAVADTGLKYGKSLSSDAEFEIFVIYEQNGQASIQQGVVTASDGATAGNSVRVAMNNRVGFASSSGFAPERVKNSVREAYEIVRSIKAEDDRFKSLADPAPPGNEADFDKKILEIGVDDLIRDSEALIADATAVDEKVTFAAGACNTTWGGYAVANTRGVSSATQYGNSVCLVNVQTKQGEERRGGVEYDVGVDRVYEIDGLGKEASSHALSLLGAKKFEVTDKMTTIWTPLSAATYMLASIGQSVLGNPVVEGISPLCDMIGDSIGPSGLSIIDDGQLKDGLGTNAIDAEGVPQRKTPIIENGILKSFLFDKYFGTVFGVESTGNCDRTGGFFGGGAPYENSPGVLSKTLTVTPGTKDLNELISEIDGRAIIIYDSPIGIFHSSVATGEFSAVAASAFLVENGEKKNPIQPMSVAGNFYDGLKNLVEIGSDLEPIPYGITLPTLVFDGFSVANQ